MSNLEASKVIIIKETTYNTKEALKAIYKLDC